MKMLVRLVLVGLIAFAGFMVYRKVTADDLKNYINDNAIVKEVKVNVHNTLSSIDLGSLGLDKLTEVTDAKTFTETQSYNFIKDWLPANYTCKYTYRRGSLMGTGNLTLYTGEVCETDDGAYIDVAWVTQKFDSIKELAGSNTYFYNNGNWYICDTKAQTMSVTDMSASDFDVYKLLTQVCCEQNYSNTTVSNIVNLGAFNVDVFKYNDNDYVFFYDSKGVLVKVVNVTTQESFDFTAFSAPNYDKVKKYASYKIK